jgi:hypothetical protein
MYTNISNPMHSKVTQIWIFGMQLYSLATLSFRLQARSQSYDFWIYNSNARVVVHRLERIVIGELYFLMHTATRGVAIFTSPGL